MQPLIGHLQGVSELSKEFAGAFGEGEMGKHTKANIKNISIHAVNQRHIALYQNLKEKYFFDKNFRNDII